jgi:hypothetical protein
VCPRRGVATRSNAGTVIGVTGPELTAVGVGPVGIGSVGVGQVDTHPRLPLSPSSSTVALVGATFSIGRQARLALRQSLDVLNLAGNLHPRVLARLVDRELRRWEAGIGERADRDGDDIRVFRMVEVNCAAAIGAEVKHESASAIARTRIFGGATFDSNIGSREAGLHAEYAAGPQLAGQTVTD